MDDDVDFELLLRNSWQLQAPSSSASFGGSRSFGGDSTYGGSTLLGSTVCRRVKVVRRDGSEDIVDFNDDFGVGRFNRESVMERLKERGYNDVVDVVIHK